MINFLNILENLSAREKILILIFALLLGAFLGFKVYDFIFSQSLSKVLYFNTSFLNEKKEKISALKSEKIELEKEFKAQKNNLENMNLAFENFKNSYQNHLNLIKKLTLKHKLLIKNLESSSQDFDFFSKYALFMQVRGDFEKILNFLQDLEGAKPYFELEKIDFQSNLGVNLALNLKLNFIILKENYK